MRKVTIVVPVLMMSCQVSDHWNRGPLTPQAAMMASARPNVDARPARRAVQCAILSKLLPRRRMGALLASRGSFAAADPRHGFGHPQGRDNG